MAPVTPEVSRRRRARALESVAFVAGFGLFAIFFWASVASLVFGTSVRELAMRAWEWANASPEHRWIAALTPFSVYGLARVFAGLGSKSQTTQNDLP